MWNLISKILAGILSFWLADRFLPGVEFLGPLEELLLAGTVLGFINFFLKPLLKVITFPVRIITFGLFGIIINMLMVWLVDIFYAELIIKGIFPLFLTSLLVLVLGFLSDRLLTGK